MPQLVVTYAINGTGSGGSGSPAICTAPCAGSFNAGPTDYDSGAVWFTALAAPYLYVAQAANGLNIYRFDNPANPSAITWVKRYDTSWFGHRVSQIWVRGNLGVAAAVQDNYGVTMLDLSDPESPTKKAQYGLASTPAIRNSYAWTLAGPNLLAATKPQSGNSQSGLAMYPINSANSTLTFQGEVGGGCSTGAYAAQQDGFALVGLSSCVHKIALSGLTKVSPTNPRWSIGIVGADHDFTTPFGNAVFVGNDHHTTPGSMVLCHAAAADVTAPSVSARNPPAGATGVRITSGVGLSFTDNLRPWTISSSSVQVRVLGTSTAVPGYYSYMLNTVNFRPAAPFAKGTTYEVAVTSAVKDLAGNGAVASVASFTTAN